MISRLLVLLAVAAALVHLTAAQGLNKRGPLGTMRFGKRLIQSYDDVDDYRMDKRSPDEETQRSIRAPLGTMRFGKRAPLGTMRFGKRSMEGGAPFGTMRFGKRDQLGAVLYRK